MLRLVRQDDYFTGYASPDGLRWRRLGTVTLALSPETRVGLAVCSGDPETHGRAEFARADFLDATRRPQVNVYTWPAGIPESDRYQVRLMQGGRTNECFVHVTRPEDREELGPEAVRRLVVKDFPAVVANDIEGNDIYEEGRKRYSRV